jgi:hypothetical protein
LEKDIFLFGKRYIPFWKKIYSFLEKDIFLFGKRYIPFRFSPSASPRLCVQVVQTGAGVSSISKCNGDKKKQVFGNTPEHPGKKRV